jgi:hypothetical protein
LKALAEGLVLVSVLREFQVLVADGKNEFE